MKEPGCIVRRHFLWTNIRIRWDLLWLKCFASICIYGLLVNAQAQPNPQVDATTQTTPQDTHPHDTTSTTAPPTTGAPAPLDTHSATTTATSKDDDEGLSTLVLVFIGLGSCVVGVPFLCVTCIALKSICSTLCQKKETAVIAGSFKKQKFNNQHQQQLYKH